MARLRRFDTEGLYSHYRKCKVDRATPLKENIMIKTLKKSFENYVNDLCAGGVIFYSKGNLCVDLERYYGLMFYDKVFYVPSGYAVNITAQGTFSGEYKIAFYKIEDSYLTLLEHFTFDKRTNTIDERLLNCNTNEYFDVDGKVVVKHFIEPLQEIIKQMQQYYVDHNLVDRWRG